MRNYAIYDALTRRRLVMDYPEQDFLPRYRKLVRPYRDFTTVHRRFPIGQTRFGHRFAHNAARTRFAGRVDLRFQGACSTSSQNLRHEILFHF